MTMRITTRMIARLAFMLAVSAVAGGTASAQNQLSGLKLNNDGPIQIESDKLEVREKDGRAEFAGNVRVAQGTTVLRAGRLLVYYIKGGEGSAATGSAAIDRIEASQKVHIQSDKQIATGDEGIFDLTSGVFTLSGKEVVLSEGDNVAVGCKLVVNTKTGRANLDSCATASGRVKMVITPKSVENR
jgi:lipopolysaccharide export system protein LptA